MNEIIRWVVSIFNRPNKIKPNYNQTKISFTTSISSILYYEPPKNLQDKTYYKLT